MFFDTADIEVEITIEGEVEPVAQGIGDGMGGTDEGLIVLVGEVLEVLNGLVELTGLEAGLDLACDKVARGLGTGEGRPGRVGVRSVEAGKGNWPVVLRIAADPRRGVLDALLVGESL
jgi:hypothetical protein